MGRTHPPREPWVPGPHRPPERTPEFYANLATGARRTLVDPSANCEREQMCSEALESGLCRKSLLSGDVIAHSRLAQMV